MAVRDSRSAKERRHSAGRYHTPAIPRNKLLPQSDIDKQRRDFVEAPVAAADCGRSFEFVGTQNNRN